MEYEDTPPKAPPSGMAAEIDDLTACMRVVGELAGKKLISESAASLARQTLMGGNANDSK